MNPEDLKYTASHEWVRVDGEIGTIGITEHAQKQLGEIVYLELPEVGHVYNTNEEFGTVESVKAVSELFAPLAGEVVETNAALASAPEAINADPYGKGWMMVVKLSDPAAVAGLMDAAAYKAFVESESK